MKNPLQRTRTALAPALLFLFTLSYATPSLAGSWTWWQKTLTHAPTPLQKTPQSLSQVNGQASTSIPADPPVALAKTDPKSWIVACMAHDRAVDKTTDPQHEQVIYLSCASLWDAMTGHDAFPYRYAELAQPQSTRTLPPPVSLQPPRAPVPGPTTSGRWKTCDIYTPPTRAHRSEYIPCPAAKGPVVWMSPVPPPPELPPPPGLPTLPPPPSTAPSYSPGQSPGFSKGASKGEFKGEFRLPPATPPTPLQQSLVKADPLPMPSQWTQKPVGQRLGENQAAFLDSPDGYRFGLMNSRGISTNSQRLRSIRSQFISDVEQTDPPGCHGSFPSVRWIIFTEPGAALPQSGRVNGFQYEKDALYIRDDSTSLYNAAITADRRCDPSADSGIAEGPGNPRSPTLPRTPAAAPAAPGAAGALGGASTPSSGGTESRSFSGAFELPATLF